MAVATRVVCISTGPKRKSAAKTDRSEAEELVRGVIRKFSDKEPLLKTLDYYASRSSDGCRNNIGIQRMMGFVLD
ncbi:hypothetical protein SDJN03_11402, partial [Cucurbita argyrosperma subsp. sororia]